MGIRSVLADVSTMSSVNGLVPIPKKVNGITLGIGDYDYEYDKVFHSK